MRPVLPMHCDRINSQLASVRFNVQLCTIVISDAPLALFTRFVAVSPNVRQNADGRFHCPSIAHVKRTRVNRNQRGTRDRKLKSSYGTNENRLLGTSTPASRRRRRRVTVSTRGGGRAPARRESGLDGGVRVPSGG